MEVSCGPQLTGEGKGPGQGPIHSRGEGTPREKSPCLEF